MMPDWLHTTAVIVAAGLVVLGGAAFVAVALYPVMVWLHERQDR